MKIKPLWCKLSSFISANKKTNWNYLTFLRNKLITILGMKNNKNCLHFLFNRNDYGMFRTYLISLFGLTRAVRWDFIKYCEWVCFNFLHYQNETFRIAHITHILIYSYCWGFFKWKGLNPFLTNLSICKHY